MAPRFRIVRVALALAALSFTATLAAEDVAVRIMPPNKAQFLQLQKFDIRVEATAAEGATVASLSVAVDGRDITASGVTDSPSPNVRNWTYRAAQFGVAGSRVFTEGDGCQPVTKAGGGGEPAESVITS